MLSSEKLYQSILHKLSLLPIEKLWQVHDYIANFKVKAIKNSPKQKETIMAFAGTWSDFNDEDFNDILTYGKNSSENAFSREVNF